MSRTGGYVRRAVVRLAVLAGVAVLGLTVTSPLAGADPISETPHSPSGDASPADDIPPVPPSPGTATPTGDSATPTPTEPTQSTLSASGTPATPTRTPTPSATPRSPSPAHTHVRLNTAVTGVRTTTAVRRKAHYSLRIRVAGGTAKHVVTRISVHPRGTRFSGPRACSGGAVLTCRLGTVHGGRTLAFHQRGRLASAARLTLYVTTTAANAPTQRSVTVLVFRPSAPRTVHRSVPRYVQAPTITRHDVMTVPEAPQATLAAPPPVTVPATPAGPAEGNMGGGAPPVVAPTGRPALPVIAPRPGPEPTPNGAPVTVRPVADGHELTGDASGPPTRTILGLLAAAASFVGLVTALVLIRRRNEQ